LGLFFWLLIPLTLIGMPLAAALLALDTAPLVGRGGEVSATELSHAQALLQRYDPRRIKTDRPLRISVRQDELNAALKAALPRTGPVNGRATIDGRGMTLAATVALSPSFGVIGRYVNLVAGIAPSDHGLAFLEFKIGQLALPGWIGAPALQAVIEALLGDGRGEEIVGSIRAVSVNGDTASILMAPLAGTSTAIVDAATRFANGGDVATVRLYYRKLIEISGSRGAAAPSSLVDFIRPIFALAARRSEQHDAVVENRAAVLALAIYLGDPRLARFVGDVHTGELSSPPSMDGHVRLGGRHDLARHFLVSAGLTIVGGRSLADVVGLDKEFRDTDFGSGFSFADLAADRAGIRFAETATASVADARRLQRRLMAGIVEQSLFPDIEDLPEDLTRAAFADRYGTGSSIAYQRIVADIDRRIESLPVYR
jgi:hypothetical protein